MCEVSYLVVAVVALTAVHKMAAQKGSECLQDGDCLDEQQWCSFGYCRCVAGLFKYEHSCYEAADFGEVCFDEEQCKGLFCLEDPTDGATKCLCDRFHSYNTDISECVPLYNVTAMMELLPEKYNTAGEIESQANFVFKFLSAAGLFVAAAGSFAVLVAMVFCFHTRSRDKKLQMWIKGAEEGRHISLIRKNPSASDASTSRAQCDGGGVKVTLAPPI